MTTNNETLVSTEFDKYTNTWLYLTNKGGVYALNPNGTTRGAVFYGSYLGLPAAAREGVRSFERIIVNSNGTYTLVANTGQEYTFTPKTPQQKAA